jgi:hypothetical protein
LLCYELLDFEAEFWGQVGEEVELGEGTAKASFTCQFWKIESHVWNFANLVPAPVAPKLFSRAMLSVSILLMS